MSKRNDRGRLTTRSSLLTAYIVVAAGLLVLVGWVFDITALKCVVAGFPMMKANTAFGFVLVGVSLILFHNEGSRRARQLARFCGIAAALLGALTLAEYVSGRDFRIDDLLFRSAIDATGSSLGRMSPAAALNFTIFGATLQLLGAKRPAALHAADGLLMLVLIIAMIALTGYLYNVSALYQFKAFSAMAVHTAVLFGALSAAFLAAPPIRGVAAFLVGDDLGAVLARRLLPVAVMAPPLIGYVRLLGQRHGYYGTELGLALFATSNVVIFTAVIFGAALSLRRADLKRRASEEALHASNEGFRLLVEGVSDYAILTLDLKGCVVSWNPGAERIHGYRASEIVGQHFSCFSTPEDSASHSPEMQLKRALEEGAYEEEGWRVRKDGSRFWANVDITALRDAQGRVRGFGKITRDVTERKRTEDAQREIDQRLRTITDHLTEGLVISSTEGQMLHWNKAACAMFGFSNEEEWLRKLPVFAEIFELTTLAGDVLKIEEWPLSRVLAGERLHNFDVYIRRIDIGSPTRILSFTGAIVQDVGGKSAAFLSFSDITQRSQSEQALRASEQRYRFMSESMPQIIWTAKPDGNFDFYNQRWYDYTGMTFEQTKDWGWERVLHPDDLQNCIDRWTSAFTTGGEYVVEYRFKRAADGTYRWHLGRASPLRNEAGDIIQWVGTCTDIDDQKRAEQNLLQAHATLEQRVRERTAELGVAKGHAEFANKSKSEFLANMSHEIRTPLNAVIGLGYLLEQTTLSEDQRQFVTKIQFAGQTLLGVINNVLDLSKIEAGEMSLEDEAFDLPEQVRDLSDMLSPQAVAKGIELLVRFAADVPRIVGGDASRLRQIFINLISNSIKFTEAGNVTLEVMCAEQSSERIRLRCEVKDTGIGIEPAALRRLFMPFTQADTSTTRRFGGTGLGLSISRRFVELMGGEIGVTSTVAVGSTFWFEIPLRVAHSIGGTLRADDARRLRILVADSNSDATAGVGTMVRALGWSPQIVGTGEQLLAVVKTMLPESWPDVLVLDLRLPVVDVRDLIARLETECTHDELPPVIVVAEHAQSYVEDAQFVRAVYVVLARPVTSSALFNAINSIIWERHDAYDRTFQPADFGGLQAKWLAGVRVLVADDSDINLEVAQRILEKQGAIVATCSDGSLALEHVRLHHQQLDVVLMDVQMPILDGNEATRRIRGELGLQKLPIVALTAGALLGERQRSIQAGMNDFISKPFDPQVLIRKVRSLVEQARGEPIPMVILESNHALYAADRLLMSSVDADVVQQMFGGDLPLFKSLLARILRDNVDLALPLCESLDDQTTRIQLKGRVHKLKGSAGMIGATRVMRLAGTAEEALHENRPVEVVERILKQLASALTTLREEAEPFLERPPEPDANSGPQVANRPKIGAADIEELRALLERQNLAAIDKFSLISLSLSERLGAAHFDRLREAIDNLDFQLGADVLRDGMKVLSSTPDLMISS